MDNIKLIKEWNILSEGGISDAIPRDSEDKRSFFQKLSGFTDTFSLNPRKVAASRLYRMRKRDPEKARELFRKNNPKGIFRKLIAIPVRKKREREVRNILLGPSFEDFNKKGK